MTLSSYASQPPILGGESPCHPTPPSPQSWGRVILSLYAPQPPILGESHLVMIATDAVIFQRSRSSCWSSWMMAV